MISGHRRLHAAQKAGLETVPAFVHPIDRDAAAIELVDSDLHREHILPSEKAFAYKLKIVSAQYAPTVVGVTPFLNASVWYSINKASGQ